MLGDVIGWGLALIVIGRFLADYLLFPVIATAMHLFSDDEDNNQVDTHAMGYDLTPYRDDFSDEEEDMKMGFKLGD